MAKQTAERSFTNHLVNILNPQTISKDVVHNVHISF